jgi:hypothetical protein
MLEKVYASFVSPLEKNFREGANEAPMDGWRHYSNQIKNVDFDGEMPATQDEPIGFTKQTLCWLLATMLGYRILAGRTIRKKL